MGGELMGFLGFLGGMVVLAFAVVLAEIGVAFLLTGLSLPKDRRPWW